MVLYLQPTYVIAIVYAKGSVCNYRQLNTGVGAMCGWCLAYCTGVVLNTVLYGKVTRLIIKKKSRLTQAVVVSEGIFCAARCCVIFHRQSTKVYLHKHVQREC